MLLIYTLLLLTVAFTANSELQDGSCPTPVATFKWEDLKESFPMDATWLVLSSNFYKAKDPATAQKCYKVNGEMKDGSYLANITYSDSYGQHNYEAKLVPSTDKLGTILEYKKASDGEWEFSGWMYTPYAYEAKYIIEHVCREDGSKYEDFFAIYGMDTNIPEDVFNNLKKQVKDYGDERDFVIYDHENC